MSMNSPRLVHNDTEIPQNLITSVNNNELRPNRLHLNTESLNTESHEESLGEGFHENLHFNNEFEQLATDRDNEAIGSGFMMNNSNSQLLQNPLESSISKALENKPVTVSFGCLTSLVDSARKERDSFRVFKN